MLAWWLLQAAVAGPMIAPPRATVPRCPENGPGDDIMVCGRAPDQEQFRVRALPGRYDPDAAALPKAETGVFGGRAKLAAEAEQAGVGGFVSNRGMVRLKIPLGR
ncbi:hypothetical protein ACMGDM_12050 [Sphingomonas sp. DT-51]|uniref:hypothetical protein n=1 Tax=Sphingomonas sp. DT-51 TaxID=3396165 RepID=UPI003F1A55AA